MAVEMVVVNGVRYRKEHAPKTTKLDEPEAKSRAPKNKARTVEDK